MRATQSLPVYPDLAGRVPVVTGGSGASSTAPVEEPGLPAHPRPQRRCPNALSCRRVRSSRGRSRSAGKPACRLKATGRFRSVLEAPESDVLVSRRSDDVMHDVVDHVDLMEDVAADRH
jgi:hypothetical protein